VLFGEPSLVPLALFRMGVAGVLLAQAVAVSPDLSALFGSHGVVQWSIGEIVLRGWQPRIGWVARALAPFGVSDAGAMLAVFLANVTSLLALGLGYRTRTAALLAWCSDTALTNTGGFGAYGLSAFAHVALFYCLVCPVGSRLSVDARTGRCPPALVPAPVALRLLQAHVAIVYLASGIEKARGPQWWNGEAIWRAVMQPQFAQHQLTWLSGAPVVTRLVGLSTLVVEIGYALFIWPRATRRLWVMATVALHLGIAIFLGLWLFSAMMIVLTASLFGYAAFAGPWRRRSVSAWLG